ncbi:MAG: phosphoribosylformylglycinamidine cyclo-ligase [Firmicutes bacterium]|nr:phosphoribosylformylglycinamidine cyclo-ligase [Bacillota bacterium]
MLKHFNYIDAGVDIDAGNKAVELIKPLAQKTFGAEVLTGLGGFAGLFSPDFSSYQEPVLVAGTDGVGTKLKIAFMLNKHDTIGEDLVAMCVNDILAQGAKPLFFLDYLATGKILPEKVEEIVSGIARGCQQAGCALLGGETAEMPGFYSAGEYDLAGFAVGIVDRSKIIDGSRIKEGDCLLGVASSGLHSNGYSLVRKVLLEHKGYSLHEPVPLLKCTLAEELIKPTIIYVPFIIPLLTKFEIKGIAHITGGGIVENLPRIIPPALKAIIYKNSWQVPPTFSLIQKEGQVSEAEMLRTFNMGLGLVLVVAKEQLKDIQAQLKDKQLQSWPIGTVKNRLPGEEKISFVEENRK